MIHIQKIKKLGLIFLTLFFFCSVSFAKTIPAKVEANKALVIIDMQPIFVTRGGHDKDKSNVTKVNQILAKQIELIEYAKSVNMPIVFIEYDGEGETNHILKQAAKKYKNVTFIKKNTDGMFEDDNSYRKDLVKYLDSKKIKDLIITGANGGACVYQSLQRQMPMLRELNVQ